MGRTAILYIAERCNQECVFCLEEDGRSERFVDPTTAEVFGHLERLFGLGARHITFMGGETFFRKDLPRILSHARSVGYTRIGVTTNGTVLSKKGFLRELVGAGLDFIELSIHGHTPELANAIGGTHFTFERQAQALAQIDELGLFTIVNVVVCRENKDHLVDVARYVVERFPRIRTRFKLKFVSLQGLAKQRFDEERAALRYDEVDAVTVGDWLEARGADFWFYNFPLCRLGRHAGRAHEVSTFAVDERYFDYDHEGSASYYDSGLQVEGRVWPAEPCRRCSLRPVCPGLEENHREAGAAQALSARDVDPLPLVEQALRARGLEPAGAAERLEELRREPRPGRVVRAKPEGAIRFAHEGEPEPFDVWIEANVEGTRAFFRTARFAMSYRAWEGREAFASERVRALVERIQAAMRDADARGLSLEEARLAAARAAAAGWTVPAAKRVAPARRGALSVLAGEPR